MKELKYEPNPGKSLLIQDGSDSYLRIPIKTKVFYKNDDLAKELNSLLQKKLKEGDIVFISEKCVACTQGRAIPCDQINPGKWARLLSHFVTHSPYGIGLSMPETMEMAIQECGLWRILAAAFAAAIARLFHLHGIFYQIAGNKARAIDGPCSFTIPPYNQAVVLAPLNPNETAAALADTLGCEVAIVDINDLGAEILGVSSSSIDPQQLKRLLKDNPLGQSDQSTPVGILRKWDENELNIVLTN